MYVLMYDRIPLPPGNVGGAEFFQLAGTGGREGGREGGRRYKCTPDQAQHILILSFPSPSSPSTSSAQPSCAGVVDLEAEESDYRANLGPGESKTLGSAEAFPLG